MGKVAKEPVSSNQAFWIAALSAGSGASLVLVAMGNVPWFFKQLWSQEAAGWAAALATVGAIWVALTASEREHARTIKLRDEQWAKDAEVDRREALVLLLYIQGDVEAALSSALSLQALYLNDDAFMDAGYASSPLRRADVFSRIVALQLNTTERIVGRIHVLPDAVAEAVAAAVGVQRVMQFEASRLQSAALLSKETMGGHRKLTSDLRFLIQNLDSISAAARAAMERGQSR